MLKKYAAAAALLSTATYAAPLLAEEGRLETRQGPGSYYPVTGATGGVFPRLEIRDLEKTGEMWNLFLLALTDFEAMDQTVIDSYYQIAGIHGMPWYPWDGVDVEVRPEMGYCPHNQVLFGTWHRPYMILFEQKLQDIARGIADRFPSDSRAKYQDAANQLRFPFWDWAMAVAADQPVYPTAVSNDKAQVTFPNGTAATIDNPLFNYDFHPLDNREFNGTGCPNFAGSGGVPSVCQNEPSTIRPATDKLNSDFRRILPSQRTSLYNILSQYQPFNGISSTSGCAPVGPGNLENIHGPVHNLHYPGHMSPAGAAAFDPIFWLHHANVDRQIALFQALYPDTYVSQCPASTPTFTINRQDPLDGDSPLTPFHGNAAGDFLTSNSVRNIRDLGYTYPDFINSPDNATLVARIRALYSGPADVPVTISGAQVKSSLKTASESSFTKYFAQVKLTPYGLDDGNDGSAPYNVRVFSGDVSSDATSWSSADNLVGIATALGGAKMQLDQVATVLIDLTSALEKAIGDGSTTSEKAVEYLKENISYRVEIGDNEIPREKVEKLEVGLVSTEVEGAKSEDTFERWVGGLKEHGSIDG